MKTFAMMVLGCKVNDYEATYLRNRLLSNDYKEVSFKEVADIYVIFTCCVTNTAESKTRKMLHHARRLNPNAYIAAVGCYVQVKHDTSDFDDVDLLIGSKNKDKLFDLITMGVKSKQIESLDNHEFEDLYIEDYPGKSRAYLKVQDGCNQFCSYCIIPYARGREISANHNKVIEQAKQLAKSRKELVLTGIHTGRYNDGEFNLYQLLSELCKIEGLETIRLSSIEVTEITDEIIDLMKNNKKIGRNLHIPVQSMSNKILKAMNRPYTFEEYLERIEYIRKEVPDISISTDLIVGFPEESEEDFSEILNGLDRAKFAFVHVFPYARKKGTVADRMSGHLNNDVKKCRVNQIINKQFAITNEFISKFTGQELDLLIETRDDEYVYGYVKQYFYVKARGNGEIGDLVKVTIDEIKDGEALGHVS